MVATIQELEDKYLATLKGELNTAAAVAVENVLKPLSKSDGRDVEIDCSDTVYISSSGLRLLLNIYKHVTQTGHKVQITGLQPGCELYEALDLAGLFTLFKQK